MHSTPTFSTDTLVDAWRSGAESAGGVDNPAGSLYTGGSATEQGLTEIDVATQYVCSIDSASRTIQCC